jgi:hypothetical protein
MITATAESNESTATAMETVMETGHPWSRKEFGRQFSVRIQKDEAKS